MVFVGIDPGFANIGVVALNKKGDVVDAQRLHYSPAKGDRQTHYQWALIGIELSDALTEIKRNYSPRAAMTIGMLAPFQVNKRASHLKLHVATGIIFGMCLNHGVASMARDMKVRQTLHPLIGCPLRFPRDSMKKQFVSKFWPECPSAHCADAWLMAKYLTIGE